MIFDLLQDRNAAADNRIPGVAVAVVTNIQDPNGEGRIKVKYPWRDVEDESDWVRMITFMAGDQMGGYFLPEVGDEVLVAFENGDIDHPIVLGALWSGRMKPPESNNDGKNNLRLIKSRSGHKVILNDEDGKETIEIIDKSGKNKIVIDTAANKITVQTDKDIELKAPQGKISLDAQELELKSSANTKIQAGANMEIKASANNKVEGGANMDVKAGAILTVQGSMVKIN